MACSIYSVSIGSEQHFEFSYLHQLHALVLYQPVLALEAPAGHKALELEPSVGVVLHVGPATA